MGFGERREITQVKDFYCFLNITHYYKMQHFYFFFNISALKMLFVFIVRKNSMKRSKLKMFLATLSDFLSVVLNSFMF